MKRKRNMKLRLIHISRSLCLNRKHHKSRNKNIFSLMKINPPLNCEMNKLSLSSAKESYPKIAHPSLCHLYSKCSFAPSSSTVLHCLSTYDSNTMETHSFRNQVFRHEDSRAQGILKGDGIARDHFQCTAAE